MTFTRSHVSHITKAPNSIDSREAFFPMTKVKWDIMLGHATWNSPGLVVGYPDAVVRPERSMVVGHESWLVLRIIIQHLSFLFELVAVALTGAIYRTSMEPYSEAAIPCKWATDQNMTT
jgi:hypothetical protein